jgi:hypothetical protein
MFDPADNREPISFKVLINMAAMGEFSNLSL